MSLPSLTVQLITASIISLQRQISHNNIVQRNQWLDSYDYVVIGGGSAGCVVASRLSEDPSVSVLLLEAGGPQTLNSDMPAEFYYGWGPEADWGYYTVPQRRAGFAFRDNRMFFQRGRLMGGSSTTNLMIYNRGNKRDFDSWGRDFGAIGWSYEEVLPYFIRSENNTDRNVVNANPLFHGTRGPMQVTTSLNPSPVLYRFLEAANMMGFPTLDLNGPVQTGGGFIQKTMTTQRVRASTAYAFLESNNAYRRDNLHILGYSQATKILTRRANNTNIAYGVQFYRNNNYYTVNARIEVILSAGAINSPQILMLSGIGPRQHLQLFDIPVVSDLPVGENLIDHVYCELDFAVRNASDLLYDDRLTVTNLYQYYELQSGPLAHFPALYIYYSTPLNDDPDWPDGLWTIFSRAMIINRNFTQFVSQFGPNRNEWEAFYRPMINNNNRMAIVFSNFRPRSHGTVRLSSANPLDPILLDPNYFGDDHDLQSLVQTMRRGLQIADSDHFRRYATLSDGPIPGCQPCSDVPLYDCYSYLQCVAQTVTVTYYHPAGTCRLGAESDPKAVVDSRLRVKGVRNLRVIDASIMPIPGNGNTNAPSIMVGERGAELVRQDRLDKQRND